jgi:hypothetical protein
VRLSWSSSTGATYYEVQQDSSSNFPFPWLIYSGPDTSIYHDAGFGTNYFRVRACDANGCSGYRDGDQPNQYYDPCL